MLKNILEPRPFSAWDLLLDAVRDFNRKRSVQNKSIIDVSDYDKLGIMVKPGKWKLQNINQEIDEAWADFCNDPENKVKFND